MGERYYEKEEYFKPIYQTSLALMRERGYDTQCDIISCGDWQIVNTEYDNWNGGTYGYTLYVNLSVKQYSLLSSEKIAELEKVFSETLNEVTKGEDNHYFHVQISPRFCKSDIDWNTIGGINGKRDLFQKIETIKNIMISVATGGNRIQEEDSRYRSLQKEIIEKCKTLNITYENHYIGLWDWYGKWKADLPTYQSRREYINSLFSPLLAIFEDTQRATDVEPIVQLDEWERLNRTIIKIKKDSMSARNEEDFQGVGLLCRETIISLAQAVYDPIIHGQFDETGVNIGKTDAVRMISNYLSVKLSGNSHEEMRAYAKTTNKLANMLTHKRTASKRDMMLVSSATISLINFIGILEDKY